MAIVLYEVQKKLKVKQRNKGTAISQENKRIVGALSGL